MRCRYCKEKLALHDIWCVSCGRQTELVKKDLSAWNSLLKTWQNYKKSIGHNFPVGIVYIVFGVIPLVLIIWLVQYGLAEISDPLKLLLRNTLVIIFLPLLISPLKNVCHKESYDFSIKQLWFSFQSYLRYLWFSFIVLAFYVIIYYICKGDPILNLVWLVLIQYWIVIIIPVPVLMERFKIGPLKSLYLSYKYGHDIRWNIYLLAIILTVINALAFVLGLICLAITIPFSLYAIRDFADKMIEYEVYSRAGSESG